MPQRVIKLKKKELQDLKQGSMTVSECVTHFTQLNRLDDGLAYALEARDFENFQTMIDNALVLKNRRGILSGKHKLERQSKQSSNSRPRISSSPARPTFHPVG
jgi:hypothetical protein